VTRLREAASPHVALTLTRLGKGGTGRLNDLGALLDLSWQVTEQTEQDGALLDLSWRVTEQTEQDQIVGKKERFMNRRIPLLDFSPLYSTLILYLAYRT
jgi:hypothetical protein